ncbi:MAG: hypothetical protein AVDCRST_MAG41-771, partial [uncultured Corynebacteriales bacterium]
DRHPRAQPHVLLVRPGVAGHRGRPAGRPGVPGRDGVRRAAGTADHGHPRDLRHGGRARPGRLRAGAGGVALQPDRHRARRGAGHPARLGDRLRGALDAARRHRLHLTGPVGAVPEAGLGGLRAPALHRRGAQRRPADRAGRGPAHRRRRQAAGPRHVDLPAAAPV